MSHIYLLIILSSITIVIVILSILLLSKSKNIAENITNKNIAENIVEKKNISFDDCGKSCKTKIGCWSFAHNNNKCNLYDEVINHQNIDTADIFCNKIFAIEDHEFTPSYHERKKNAIYMCNDKKTGDVYEPNIFYHNNNKMIKIDEGVNIDYMPNVDKYDVYI
jgi:hypothetical protein